MGAILEKNLKAIERKNPRLYKALLQCTESVELEKTRSGDYTFRFNNIYFHSRYDPWREAKQQLEEISSKQYDILCFFGMGCGYLLRLVMHKRPSKLLIFEPSLAILKGVLTKIDLSGVLASAGVYIYADIDQLISYISSNIEGTEDILSYQSVPYIESFPEKLFEYNNKIKNAQVSSISEIHTNILSRLDWNKNYLKNIPNIAKYPVVDRLVGKFKDVPLIIVGAGPSLRKNVHLLKELKGRALIIAAITAHRILLGRGIVPDLVMAAEKIDMSEYFTDSPEERNTRLVLPELVYPGTFDMNVKGKFVYFSSFLELGRLHAKYWGSQFLPHIGGSVTTVALSLGIAFGCNPIVFIGQDLTYSEDGMSHAPGGVYSEQELRIDKDSDTVTISNRYIAIKDKHPKKLRLLWLKGQDGRMMPSSSTWVTFHRWFEDYMEYLKNTKPDIKVINATEGGAYIKGMEHIPLKTVIDRYIDGYKPIEEIIDAAEREEPQRDAEGLKKSFDRMIKRLKEIGRISRNIVSEAERLKRLCEACGISPSFKEGVDRIKRLEDRLFNCSDEVGFIWEVLVAYTYKLKSELKAEPDNNLKEEFLKSLKLVIESYSKISSVTERLLPDFIVARDTVEELLNRKETIAYAQGIS